MHTWSGKNGLRCTQCKWIAYCTEGQTSRQRLTPSYEVPDKISTKITLWEVEANVGGMLTWSYWKSVFNWRPDYNVIVHQKDPIKDKTYTFVVHETENLEVANAAFKSVCETLEPLVDDCAVIFTKPLLEGIVTPMPKKTAELPLALTDLMIVNPDAHSDWATVLRALWRKPLVHDDVDSIAGLAEQGGGVHQQDNEGNTFLHRAVTAGSAKGVEIIIEMISETEKQKLVKATNKHGKAAIHFAFEHNNPDIVRILVQSGADLTMAANDDDGSNSFHLAAQNDSAKCIQAVHHISAAEHQKIKKAFIGCSKQNGFHTFDVLCQRWFHRPRRVLAAGRCQSKCAACRVRKHCSSLCR